LSASTERYDRGGKWEIYRRMPSLRDYVLVTSGAELDVGALFDGVMALPGDEPAAGGLAG
jgi:hypothetical protein